MLCKIYVEYKIIKTLHFLIEKFNLNLIKMLFNNIQDGITH